MIAAYLDQKTGMSRSFVWGEPFIERSTTTRSQGKLFTLEAVTATTRWNKIRWMAGQCWVDALWQPVIYFRAIHFSIAKWTDLVMIFLLERLDKQVPVETTSDGP